MDATITLKEFLEKRKIFVIPDYQRGYIWGKNKKGYAKDSVRYILEDSLIPGFKKKQDLFLQGVTVSEQREEIIVIDGQQRTTFFFLLLKSLGYTGAFSLQYSVRQKSNDFLKSTTLLSDTEEKIDEEYQDIYFFKKTLRIISETLSSANISQGDFLDYVLNSVKFLYIDIPDPEQAIKIFSMMNGNRAVMLPEEIIKAEMLRVVSLHDTAIPSISEKEKQAREWDCNLLRSRYAREWDKWLQWWNRKDVRNLFRCENVMGWLISTYLKSAQKDSDVQLLFESFKHTFLNKELPVQAKKAFDGLRRLQKRFEDAFQNPVIYNHMGAILRIWTDTKKRETFINWYFTGEKKTDDELRRYYKFAFLGLTHSQILEKDDEKLKNSIEENLKSRLDELSDDDLYNNNKKAAFKLLLRLNIDEDTKQNRKFNFDVWNHQSLEHIYPKSKVFHFDDESKKWFLGNGDECTKKIRKSTSGDDTYFWCIGDECTTHSDEADKTYIDRSSCIFGDVKTSEHSIGNLVLLYCNENSSLGKKMFEEKKDLFFNPSAKEFFASRHLLHTLYKFAGSSWTGCNIAQNKQAMLKDLEAYYGK